MSDLMGNDDIAAEYRADLAAARADERRKTLLRAADLAEEEAKRWRLERTSPFYTELAAFAARLRAEAEKGE